MHAAILQDDFRFWWLHGTTNSSLPVGPWGNQEWNLGGTRCLQEGAGESGACFNHLLCGIGIFVKCLLLFLSIQQHSLSSFSSVCCQLGYSVRYLLPRWSEGLKSPTWAECWSSLPLPTSDASVGEELGWHIVSPVGLVIYFCIPIHNSIITDLRQ